jgi:hypothetical protein
VIHLDDYLARVASIKTQFYYMRHAIVGFIASQGANLPASKTPDDMIAITDPAKASDEEFLSEMDKFVEQMKGGFPNDKKEIENRLAQNEIILMVAVFEDQMKSIHREILQQNPKLLNDERAIPLGRLTSMGEKAIIEEEIERAVQLLDRSKVQDRAKSFEKLGIPWEMPVEKVERILNLRNEILHKDMNKEVSGWDLTHTYGIILVLPWGLCSKASKLYPNAFEVPPLLWPLQPSGT